MQVKIVEDESKSLIIELEGWDRSIAELIKEKLEDSKDVEFSSVEKDHPEVGVPRLVVKSSKNAKGLVVKAIEQLQDELKDLAAEIPKK